ncbi:MAG: hypothetical protein NVS2B12_13420 [Ktedonobacteraceae bacterium]
MVPSFSIGAFAIAPPASVEMRPARNGICYKSSTTFYLGGRGDVYTPGSKEIDLSMGFIPTAVVYWPERTRGNHPLNSFVAIGPLAQQLIKDQNALDVYAPLRALTERDGAIVLMGVGLERMTFLHYAEQQAGRVPFRRWANGPDHKPQLVAVGSCSEGFDHFNSLLAPFNQQFLVGESIWQVFPTHETLKAAVAAIKRDPFITHCDESDCERCADAIRGGPLLSAKL